MASASLASSCRWAGNCASAETAVDHLFEVLLLVGVEFAEVLLHEAGHLAAAELRVAEVLRAVDLLRIQQAGEPLPAGIAAEIRRRRLFGLDLLHRIAARSGVIVANGTLLRKQSWPLRLRIVAQQRQRAGRRDAFVPDKLAHATRLPALGGNRR